MKEIIDPERWKSLKHKVYYQLVTEGGKVEGDKEIVLKLYKIDEDIELSQNSINSIMDKLMEKKNVTEGFAILEKKSLVLNSFRSQELYSDFYSMEKEQLKKTFEDVKNFAFKGIRAEIVNHERRAWDKYLHTKDKSIYTKDIFKN